MSKKQKVNTDKTIHVVTANSFITACGLDKISLKARKLLYIAISQCKIKDNEFYEYSIKVSDFSKMMKIDSSNVYKEADKITDELMRGFVKIVEKGKKKYKKYSLFSFCECDNAEIKFKLNDDMTDFLLALKGNFSKPLLDDFLCMKSKYSMAVWHLMQLKMNSEKPFINGEPKEFDLMLDELREVTGTQNKLKQISQFKERVLDEAIKEIYENCYVNIEYSNIKEGRIIIGFHFKAMHGWYHED